MNCSAVQSIRKLKFINFFCNIRRYEIVIYNIKLLFKVDCLNSEI